MGKKDLSLCFFRVAYDSNLGSVLLYYVVDANTSDIDYRVEDEGCKYVDFAYEDFSVRLQTSKPTTVNLTDLTVIFVDYSPEELEQYTNSLG